MPSKIVIQENRRVEKTGIRRNQILDDLTKRDDSWTWKRNH